METLIKMEKPIQVSYQDFENEKNAKNQAYAFILASGNFEAFKQFCDKSRDVENPHDLCVSLLLI